MISFQNIIKAITVVGIITVSFLCESCNSSTEPTNEYSISITTQNNSYSRTGAVTVISNLKNNSSTKVYLPIDSTFTLEEKDGDTWTGGIWSIHRMGSFSVYSLIPNASHSEEMPPGFLPSKGTYRFKFFIYKDSSLTELLPDNLLYSNTFEATE